MSARYTAEQASKLSVVEPSARFIKPRKTAQEIKERLELEAVREKIVPKAEPPMGNKYRNKKPVIDGIKLDSVKEGKRWQELKLLEKAGKISKLERQVNISLEVNGYKVCGFRPDFRYIKDGAVYVEDVKGMRFGVAYEKFRLKAKLFRAIFGYDVVEI